MGWDGNKLADAMRRKRNERDANAVAAMRGVTADPPEGAVLELWRALKLLEWSAQVALAGTGLHSACPACSKASKYTHNDNCWLDAALSRFRVDGEGA